MKRVHYRVLLRFRGTLNKGVRLMSLTHRILWVSMTERLDAWCKVIKQIPFSCEHQDHVRSNHPCQLENAWLNYRRNSMVIFFMYATITCRNCFPYIIRTLISSSHYVLENFSKGSIKEINLLSNFNLNFPKNFFGSFSY